MKPHTSAAGIFLAGLILLICAGAATPLRAQAPTSKPSAKVIALDAHGGDYLQLLGGAPETVTMRSGLVILAPQHSVRKHSTNQNEEILIVLAGRGEMTFKDGHYLPVEANHAVYCPPQTEHDVKNTGTDELRYVYVVAAAKP
jgi:mannose-6-phosphate isomerase-like protein (cupin superfamily)